MAQERGHTGRGDTWGAWPPDPWFTRHCCLSQGLILPVSGEGGAPPGGGGTGVGTMSEWVMGTEARFSTAGWQGPGDISPMACHAQ